MKILIGGTEITVKKCYPYEYASGKRELRFTVSQSVIDYTALKEMLAANTGEIILTKDDGATQTFSGYTFAPEILDKTENEESVFYVVIQCVAEAERQALEAKAEAAALRKLAADQAESINNLLTTVENLNQQLLVVQLAAAELYEQSLPAETPEDEDYSGSQYTVDDELEDEQEVQ